MADGVRSAYCWCGGAFWKLSGFATKLGKKSSTEYSHEDNQDWLIPSNDKYIVRPCLCGTWCDRIANKVANKL